MPSDRHPGDTDHDNEKSDMAIYRYLAFTMVPNRSHPHGTGWGGGNLEWSQREGHEIRREVERATSDAIRRVSQ